MRKKIQEQQLTTLFKSVSKMKEDDEFKPHLTKYLCIQTSGYLENVVKDLIENYLENTCTSQTRNYVTSKVSSITNLTDYKLGEFLKSFSQEWYDTFNTNVNEELKSSLNSIIGNRNQIAHGKSIGLTYSAIKRHFDDLQQVILVLESIIAKKGNQRRNK